MLLLLWFLWGFVLWALGGPVQKMTSRGADPEQDGGPKSAFHRLPVFFHTSGPLVAGEVLRPVLGTRAVDPSLAALLLPPSGLPQQQEVGEAGGAVKVWCGMDEVSVRLDRFQLQAWTSPLRFHVGSCGPQKVDPRFLYFQFGLTECDGEATVVGGQLVYTFLLQYTPPPQDRVIRVPPLTLLLHCHYNRFHYSYKIGFRPQVQLATFVKNLRRKLTFSLTVCNAQWEPLSRNHWVYLGEQVYFVARTGALLAGERLFVDSCYATSSQDPNSLPRMEVISNYGCMADSKREGSSSMFLSSQANEVKFSVDAFLFRATSEVQYLHCSMSVGWISSHTAKTCNYNQAAGRWEDLGGPSTVCSCCQFICGEPQKSTKTTASSLGWSVGAEGESQRTTWDRGGFQVEEQMGQVQRKKWKEKGLDVHLNVKTKADHGDSRKWWPVLVNLSQTNQEALQTNPVVVRKTDGRDEEAGTDVFIKEDTPENVLDSKRLSSDDTNVTPASGFAATTTPVTAHKSSSGSESSPSPSEEMLESTVPDCSSCSAASMSFQEQGGKTKNSPAFTDSSTGQHVGASSAISSLKSGVTSDFLHYVFDWSSAEALTASRLWSDRMKSLNESVDSISEETPAEQRASLSPGLEKGPLHQMGDLERQCARSPLSGTLICGDGLPRATVPSPRSEEGKSLPFNQFAEDVKIKSDKIPGTTSSDFDETGSESVRKPRMKKLVRPGQQRTSSDNDEQLR